MTNTRIDLDRCYRGARNIEVCGSVPGRESVIADAIRLIQDDGATAMQRERLNVKNYDRFGDQRCDMEYGYGPKHETIVFSVGRTRDAINNKSVLGADEIYLLECVRDFGRVALKSGVVVQLHHRCGDYRHDEDLRRVGVGMNLTDVLAMRSRLAAGLHEVDAMLDTATVEDHSVIPTLAATP